MAFQRIHFISIGGSVMSSLAIALKGMGYAVSGSDDRIYEPSRSRLATHGLLPAQEGWRPDQVSPEVEMVVLGMHAKKDNPELRRAQELGIPIRSFPEYISEAAADKHRIVVGGSHGKTTITGLILHTLLHYGRKVDYVVGAHIKGIDNGVRLSADAPIMVIEGDEYPSSPLDDTPKFLRYQHHVGIVSGIAWDHANVFTSKEAYIASFQHFADATPRSGALIYNAMDSLAKSICGAARPDVSAIAYEAEQYSPRGSGMTLRVGKGREVTSQLAGPHNAQNIAAARAALNQLGMTAEQFYDALPLFEGVEGRLSIAFRNAHAALYRDFAHSPSKTRASVWAVRELYPQRPLVGCVELHTLGSLNPDFLQEYFGSLDACDTAAVYYHAEKMKTLTPQDVRRAFGRDTLEVFTDTDKLAAYLLALSCAHKTLLLMSSGTFGELDLKPIIDQMSDSAEIPIV